MHALPTRRLVVWLAGRHRITPQKRAVLEAESIKYITGLGAMPTRPIS
jgi:hypothetical protein